MAQGAIAVESLGKSFHEDSPVISNLTFSVGAGSIVSLVGRSGCGKSTVLNIIAGFERASSGKVCVQGQVGYVTQQDLLLPWRTALENVLLPAELKGKLERESIVRAEALLEEFGLLHSSDYYPEELSGGMRQRIALARTLLHDADNILLDEPFSALDFDVRLRIGNTLRQWVRERKKAALFVTHHIDEAIALSDEILVLGAHPARILLHQAIRIPEEERLPDRLRRREDAQAIFGEVFRLLGSEPGEERPVR